jgi:hypothetical protein
MEAEEIVRLKEYASEVNPEAIFFDGLDDAIIGIANQHGSETVVAYSESKIMGILMDQNKWDMEEAQEWYDYNIACLGVTNGTPVIVIDNWSEE